MANSADLDQLASSLHCLQRQDISGFSKARVNGWAAPGKNVNMRNSEAPSVSASAQSDQGLQCPLTDSMTTTECIKGEQRPG